VLHFLDLKLCSVFCCREAVGNYAESQRISAVRKVYQRGIVTPMLNIEQMWKEYCAFENVITRFKFDFFGVSVI
jgi:hypothetical protein